MPSPIWSNATTASSEDVGALVFTSGPARRGATIARPRKHGFAATARTRPSVFDDAGIAQGWCQYGSPEELPNIKHGREYNKDAPPRPDWRITCFYVDKKHRGQGIARTALEGALNQIAWSAVAA